MKTIIGLSIGIILAAAVIIPLGNARTDAELEALKAQIALETAQAEIEALKAAQTAEPTTDSAEPQEIEAIVELAATEPQETTEVTAIAETAVESEPTPEPTVKAESTVEPEAEVKQASTPQVQASEPPAQDAAQPETWWEDGKQYTMINGNKAEIREEGNIQLGYFDWLNSEGHDVRGPFTGNGGN